MNSWSTERERRKIRAIREGIKEVSKSGMTSSSSSNLGLQIGRRRKRIQIGSESMYLPGCDHQEAKIDLIIIN